MKYWLVGASWGGQDHQDQSFVENGYWVLGWESSEQPDQFAKGEKIQVGDRIAIKRMKGQGSSEIKILHIGIVKGVIAETDKVICVVDWIVKNLDRNVESRGCFKSIHGPYDKDEWIEKIFCL
ncbi:hypothetical protein [Neisseria dentiae]|uniref:hypothetical protein n=1 Tax=Neisseria dentiae TaxID=194197 RepID=UPI00359FCA22